MNVSERLTLCRGTSQRALRLKKKLSEGGEGVVYLTSEPGMLAKIWDAKHRTADVIHKLEAMLHRGCPSVPSGVKIAWPVGLLRSGRNVVGYAMPHVQESRSLYAIYSTKTRLEKAVEVTWRFQHEVAKRLAEIVAAVHHEKMVVGDFNPKNVLVEPSGTVVLIDVDSWQIPDPRRSGSVFFCGVGMPEFTAPELIGHDLRRVVRSRESDCFLLAVLVYHLLLFDHPFQGKWRQRSEVPPISESVKLGISVFDKSGRMSFPEVQMPIERLWPPLAEMFRDCFTAGCHDPAKRPTADQWSHVLAEASLMLSTCSRETKHFVLEHWKDCYWCGLRQKGLDLYPSSSTPHPAVPPFGKRVEHSLRVGDDVWIAEQWKSSSAAKRVLSKHSKVRAIRAAVDRVKTLSDWRHSVDQCPHDFWLPLTLWPKSLDGTPLTQRERFRGRSIAEYIAKLRQLRREVDTATPLIAKWRHQRDVEHREQSAPRIIAKFGSICSVLPKEAPEAAALSACHAEAKEFHGRLTSMKEVLNKALQLYDLGEYDEAREGLDSLGAEWETYPLLTAARAQLDAFRLPWDRPELRARIRQAIAAEDYSTAESGLALLPEVALRSERELVRRRRQKFESVIESAYSVLEAGNAHSDDADRVVDSLRETMFSSGRELILARLAFARRLNPPPQIAEVRRTPSVKRRTPTAAASVSAVRSEAIRRDVADRHELDEVEKVGIPVVAWVTMVLFVISCTAAAVIAFIR